jgi:quinoprotein glucose dehydrogenase
MAWFLQMKKTNVFGAEVPQGERIYRQNCASCHKANRAGIALSGYPSLVGVSNRLSEKQIQEIITRGKGIMPGFPQLSTKDRQILINFLTDKGNKNETSEGIQDNIEETFLPFKFTGYNKFLDKNGLPAIAPPWGTLQALDLNTGEYLWKVPLGETVSLRNLGYPTTGTENYGGPVVTKNGLLFIAATKDGYIRSFDKKTGSLIWEFKLPAPAFATPSIYAVDGKQYLVIACGGEKLQTKKGNKIIAFALEKIEKN